MRLRVEYVDYAPGELYEQVPFHVNLLRLLPGPDRPDYWVGELDRPLRWIVENIEREVTHLVIAARWQGTQVESGVEHLPIGIAYVTDQALINSSEVDLEKCKYVAIGLASEVSGGNDVPPPTGVMSGRIAKAFGVGGGGGS